MLSKISAFFECYLQPIGGASASLSQEQKQLAVAALLIEVAMADHVVDDRELLTLQRILKQKFTTQIKIQGKRFGSARYIRNIFEKAIENQTFKITTNGDDCAALFFELHQENFIN